MSKKPTNRNPIKQWEITYPQSGDVGRTEFINSFPPCTSYICAREEHKDGGYHLHAGLKLTKGLSHAKLLNWVKTKWPDDWKRIHFTPVKNMGNWIAYCKKEDPEAIELEEPFKRRVRREDPAVWVANEALERATLRGEAKRAIWLKEEAGELLRKEDQWDEYFKRLGY